MLRSEVGQLVGRLKLVRLPARTLQVHWPEGNVLISGSPSDREPASKVPDYNALVTVEAVDATAGTHAAAAGTPAPAPPGGAASPG